MLSPNKEQPKYENPLSEFMRNGSDEEHQRVFKKVIEESIQDQLAVIAKADKMRAKKRAHTNGRLNGRAAPALERK